MAQGWYRYKLNRELSKEEAQALRWLSGPIYQKWAKAVIAHENCAWLFEQWVAATAGLTITRVEKPAIVEHFAALPPCKDLREWVPSYLTPFQLSFFLEKGHLDGALAVLPTGAGKSLTAIVYGIVHGLKTLIITRAAARRTLAGEVRKYTILEPVVLEKVGQQIPAEARFVVVGWESLQFHLAAIMAWGFNTVIFDESHVAANHKRREAVVARNAENDGAQTDNAGQQVVEYRKLNNRFSAAEDISRAAQWRLATTATPIRDRMRNLWGQVDLIIPKGLGYFYDYARRYCGSTEGKFGGIDTRGRGSDAAVQELVGRMSFFTYYVSQATTHRDLPPKRRQVTYIQPSELDSGRDVLKELKEHGYNSSVGEVWSKLAHAAAMKRSRVIEEAVAGAYRDASGNGGGKVVVFTGLRKDCDKIAAGIKKAAPDLQVWCGHGGTPAAERDQIREAYMAHPGPCVLVGTGDSWGESLNLQDTDIAIIAMLPWTPGQIRQWEGRFVRLGMKRPVLIMYLVAEGTADEHVAHALLSKLPAVEAIAKDETLGEFAVDLRGDEEAVAMGLWAKITADDDDVEEATDG